MAYIRTVLFSSRVSTWHASPSYAVSPQSGSLRSLVDDEFYSDTNPPGLTLLFDDRYGSSLITFDIESQEDGIDFYALSSDYSGREPPSKSLFTSKVSSDLSISASVLSGLHTWTNVFGEVSVCVYAVFRARELIVTYDPNGGTSSRYFDRVYAGKKFPALPIAEWDDETTSRWYTSATGGTEVRQGDTVTQTEDFTLYAHWNRTEQFTVTFDAAGGTSSETMRTVNAGSAIGTLPTATRTGYAFKGWFLSSGGGTAITSSYVVSADTYLYAHWDGNPYTVTFNGNGGTPSFSSKGVKYGSQYGTLPTCAQTGKTFLGWFTAASGGTKIESTTIFQLQSNQTLYAHWSDVDPAVKWYYLVSPA